MPFPASPTNGQLANINNISYSYSTASGTWSKTSLGTANVSLITSNGGTITGPITFTAGSLTFSAGNVTNPGVTFVGSTSSGIYAPGSNGLGITTNGANAIVIDSSQQVGLNTATPTQRLTISGTASNNIYENITNGTQNLLLGLSSTNLPLVGTSSNDPVAFFTNNTEKARFDAGGNLVIGITSTTRKLHVATGSATDTFARVNNTAAQVDIGAFANGLAYSGYANSDVITGTSSAGTWRVFTSGTEAVRVASTGNVGIGQSSPTALLHIAAGTATKPPVDFDAGTLTTSTVAGTMEYDGNVFYLTPDTNSGRAVINTRQIMYMTGDFGPIGGAITNFFGATSAVNCQPDHTYLIQGQLIFAKNTAGSVSLSLINSQTPAQVNYVARGIDSGGVSYILPLNASTATNAAVTTASIPDTRVVNFDFNAMLETNATLTSAVKIQIACGAGTVTVRRGSWWSITKLQGNTGTTGNTGAFISA